MPKTSAGLLMYRLREGRAEFLLVHPGGPFWKNKDAGAWTIPKGEPRAGEEPLAAAKREFAEELGIEPPAQGSLIELTTVRQKGGKTVQAWAFAGDFDPGTIRSNTFTLEFPPGSGKHCVFPEVDRAAFFQLEEAKLKINPAQAALLEEVGRKLSQAG
jgi:predicted NUDIX family NTP pyrophosphohydrolase